MRLINEIPDSFWTLFRSPNREIYIEALLQINEEYQYSNYYLSREICVQTLSNYFSRKKISLEKEELEDDFDLLEPLATRVLNWLLRTKWLRKVDDYQKMSTNIVIPDYAAVFVNALEELNSEEEDTTQIYIQNVYAIIFALNHDPRASVSLLKTALVNTRKLNKTLQDMLHNMDKFFGHLLEQDFYGSLLKEHLDGYVEQIVKKKYHILKTSDNFYLYKNDIKIWLHSMRENQGWLDKMKTSAPQSQTETAQADILEKLDLIERGFDDIEARIANMDKEHSRYVSATVMRLNYLLNEEDSMKGMVIDLLNHLSAQKEYDKALRKISSIMNLSQVTITSDQSLYKRRLSKADFTDKLEPDEEFEELSRDEVMNLNKIHNRYNRKQIDEFVLQHMSEGILKVDHHTVTDDGDFEKLVLAYDYAIRRDSPYKVETDGEVVDNGRYSYPKLTFIKKSRKGNIEHD